MMTRELLPPQVGDASPGGLGWNGQWPPGGTCGRAGRRWRPEFGKRTRGGHVALIWVV